MKMNGLWVEDFRPGTIDDCILPTKLKQQFKDFVAAGEIPSLLFYSSAGTGKTSVAKSLCNDLKCDYIMINGSEESGIDVLRTKVKNFAATVSLTSEAKHKVIIIDEFDYVSAAVQPALRGLMEEFSSNVRFIFTCNFKNRIIQPLHSRCSVINFNFAKEDAPELMAGFFMRAVDILNKNNIKCDKKVLGEFIKLTFPDFRKTLNELQRYSISGEIDSGILASMDNAKFIELISYLKDKNFKEIRHWVGSNTALDANTLFQQLYDTVYDYLEVSSIPEIILILGDYSYKHSFVANPEINIMACMTEIMVTGKFKNV